MNLVVGSASYNETKKAQFKKEAMALLRKVVKILGLEKGTYNIRYDKAGIACSGDATLHADYVYVAVNLDGIDGVLVRTCKGQKDYTGGSNNFYRFTRLAEHGAEGLAEFVRLIGGYATP